MARKLGINFDALFPGKSITIGEATLDIKPLSLAKLASVTRKLKELGPLFTDQGVSWENYQSETSVLTIANIILSNTPDLLEEVTDIDIEDIQQLPISNIVELLSVVVEVNTEAKDTLSKNFVRLVTNLGAALPAAMQSQAEKSIQKRDLSS